MTETEQPIPKDIWANLSEDGQKCAIALATGGGLTQGKWFIDAMSQDDSIGFDQERGLSGLRDTGVLEEITLIQEKKEQLDKMEKPREIMLIPVTEVPAEKLKERLSDLTDAERSYLRLQGEIAEYGQNKGKQPERYKGWEEPRFRLTSRFQSFIEEMSKEK